MNFLSHLYLSGSNSDILIGNYLGDFIRGNQFDNYSEEIQQGIKLHRAIDHYTDQHIAVKEAYLLTKPYLGRYGQVAVDIFFDYFLAKDWENHHHQDLKNYERQTLSVLNTSEIEFPERAQRFLHYLNQQQMLSGYAKMENLQFVFHGMSRRASFDNSLIKAPGVLQEHEEELSVQFNSFIEDLKRFVASQNPHFQI